MKVLIPCRGSRRPCRPSQADGSAGPAWPSAPRSPGRRPGCLGQSWSLNQSEHFKLWFSIAVYILVNNWIQGSIEHSQSQADADGKYADRNFYFLGLLWEVCGQMFSVFLPMTTTISSVVWQYNDLPLSCVKTSSELSLPMTCFQSNWIWPELAFVSIGYRRELAWTGSCSTWSRPELSCPGLTYQGARP